MVTPTRLTLLTSKMRSPALSRPGTQTSKSFKRRSDQKSAAIIPGIAFPTVQSCQPPADHPLDVHPELLSALLFVAPNYLHTCGTEIAVKDGTGRDPARGQRSELTESFPAVPELQPLDGSVGAVWTHDRPDGEHSTTRSSTCHPALPLLLLLTLLLLPPSP